MSLVYGTTENCGYVCILCKKPYATQSNLNRHLKENHELKSEVVYDEEAKSFKCLEGCNFSFITRIGLLDHLKNKHKIPVEQEERQFSSREEFQEWLKLLQVPNNIKYVRNSISKKMGTVSIYYTCSRSGKPKNKQISNRKSKDSKKMNMPCTSYIKYIETVSGRIEIQFYKTHYGHDLGTKCGTKSVCLANVDHDQSSTSIDNYDENEITSEFASQIERQDSHPEDAVQANELKKGIMYEIRRLKRNSEQVSDTQILKKVSEQLLTLNQHLESENRGSSRIHETSYVSVRNQSAMPLDKEILHKNSAKNKVLVVQHDHAYINRS